MDKVVEEQISAKILSGNVAIITGGATGIGKAVCKALIQKGVKVCFVDVNVEESSNTLKELRKENCAENVMFIECDVSDEQRFEDAIVQAKSKFGRFDILVNNAGITGEQNWRRTLDVNLCGPMLGTLLAQRYMSDGDGKRKGTVINTLSNLALETNHLTPTYCAAKHGLLAWTKCWGDKRNVERTGIKVNAVCPSGTDTPLFYKFYETSIDPESAKELGKGTLPIPVNAVADVFIKLLEDDVSGAVAVIGSEKEGMHYLTD